jgi:hypothetical protein
MACSPGGVAGDGSYFIANGGRGTRMLMVNGAMGILEVLEGRNMTTVLEQALGLSADEKLRLISALCESMAKDPEKVRIDQLLLVAVDQIERGECEPWQPGEGRKILDDVIRRHQGSGSE